MEIKPPIDNDAEKDQRWYAAHTVVWATFATRVAEGYGPPRLPLFVEFLGVPLPLPPRSGGESPRRRCPEAGSGDV